MALANIAMPASIGPYIFKSSDISGLTCSNYTRDQCITGESTYNATGCENYLKCENVAASTRLEAQRKATAEATVRYGDISRQYMHLLLICINLCIGIIFFLWLAWNYYT